MIQRAVAPAHVHGVEHGGREQAVAGHAGDLIQPGRHRCRVLERPGVVGDDSALGRRRGTRAHAHGADGVQRGLQGEGVEFGGHGGVDRVELANMGSRHPALTPVFSGAGLRQLAWSPDGRWLLISWPQADQWVFVRVAGKPRIVAVSHIAEQFGAHASAGRGFPRLDGWCCQRWPTPR